MGVHHFPSQAAEPKTASAFFPRKGQKTAVARRRSRVLMVGTHLTKTRGGITTLTAGIIGSELKEDFDFIHIASQAEDFGRVRKMLLAVTAGARFIRICLFKRPRLVYIHLGSNASLYRESAFILIAKLLRKKILSHFHAGDINEYFPRQPKWGQDFIKAGIGASNKVIAVSQESARHLRGIWEGLNISVIPNVIDTSAFSDESSFSGEDKAGGPVRLLFVGAAGKLKGEQDLIKALALLKSSKPNIKVDFLGFGAGKLAKSFRKAGISDLIGHLGPVPANERIAFFQRADIFVLPTYAEAMPISVIEAMAAGKAIITTAVGGIPELITNGEEGLLFQPGDVEGLADNIAFLIGDPEACLALGNNARRRIREQMDFTAYIGKLRKELSRACGRNHS
jgi:glycosyltransferase involved in cell wall biosynthesis